MGVEGKLLLNLTDGSVVCEHLAVADNARRRMRGLLGRDSLPPGEGMLLQPAPSIHTAFMRFAIDAVFVDGTLRVKKIVRGLQPWRLASAHAAWGVVELAEGEIEERRIALGDQLGVIEVTDRVGNFGVNPAWICGPWNIANGNGGTSTAGNGSNAGGHEAFQPPYSNGSEPTRVLVVGTDRRFRCVAAALLSRRGCTVTLADRASDVAHLAVREDAAVVLLDAGLALTEAARAAAQIDALDRPVGVVLVGEEPDQSLATMPVLRKWGSFDQLYKAVQNAAQTRNGVRARGKSR